jgi:SSS family solute:Na+ symporter
MTGRDINVTELTIFAILFAIVAGIGFAAARWRRASSLADLEEWGLAGRGFGTFVSWFLIGGDLYTAYTFIAIPALVYGAGALGFFAVPYTIIIYPFVFLVMPRLWAVSHLHRYVTPADFIRGRFDSKTLALVVALTGILATMPYIALQLVGIQAVLQSMGLEGKGIQKDLPLIIAFIVLALYTYSSGLRAPALIAFVKDILIYVVILVAVIYIPIKLGGYGHIFESAKHSLASKPKAAKAAFIPSETGYAGYSTLALGSAFALFMYPHSITAILATRSRNVIKRNAAILPAYSFLLGLIALLGFMALAAGVKVTNNNLAVPELFQVYFPSWFVGIAFSAIAIGALVPAAIMSIAASNLFARNIWKAYIDRDASVERVATVSKVFSLFVKLGALVIILAIKTDFAINFQLLGGVWILQTFPAIVGGLYTRALHRWALLAGWFAGMFFGTWMAYATSSPKSAHFAGSIFQWHLFGMHFNAYHGLIALVINLIVVAVVSIVLNATRVNPGRDETEPSDYTGLGQIPSKVGAEVG